MKKLSPIQKEKQTIEEQLYFIIEKTIWDGYSNEEDLLFTKCKPKLESFISGWEISFFSQEEVEQKLREMIHSISNISSPASLVYDDGLHDKFWWDKSEIDLKCWQRYRRYLLNKWNAESVARLDETSNKIMNYLGDPNSDIPFQRRGLLFGEVQSGKTATYTAICNKAIDSGYRLIIVLAGIQEILRQQTQERLDIELVGNVSLQKFGSNTINTVSAYNLPGITYPNIFRYTDIETDFKSDRASLDSCLSSGQVLFVIKKNGKILRNLLEWLNKSKDSLIDVPLLLLDDEADNASVNTNKEDEDPTVINGLINDILQKFTKASYVAITATPFANIFIDSTYDENNMPLTLFPKHFLTVLEKPKNYIGMSKFFRENIDDGSDNEYEDDPEDMIIPIYEEEQENYFKLGHNKSILDTLNDLPPSLKESIYYYVLVCAISNYRKQKEDARSMLIHTSRFIDVQNHTKVLVDDFLDEIKNAVVVNDYFSIEEKLHITHYNNLKEVFEKYNLHKTDISFEELIISKDNNNSILASAISVIKVFCVNSKYSNKKQKVEMSHNLQNLHRAIVVGGNILSRGFTINGLCVSYFYRKSNMYDTLLQMCRWFGYREGYENLVKLWTGESILYWYQEISEAVQELQESVRQMEKEGATPEMFGLKVRQNIGSLLVTARNKMRSTENYLIPIDITGHYIEAPMLEYNLDILNKNADSSQKFLQEISKNIKVEFDENVNAFIWRNVPVEYIIKLIKAFKANAWSLYFNTTCIAEYLEKNHDESLKFWDVAIPSPQHAENKATSFTLELGNEQKIQVNPQLRNIELDPNFIKVLKISGKNRKVGSGGCTKIGLSKEVIDNLRKNNEKLNDSLYLRQERNPLLLVHIVKKNDKNTALHLDSLIYTLGIGFPGIRSLETINYVMNPVALKQSCVLDEMDDVDE